MVRICVVGCGAVSHRWYLRGLAAPSSDRMLVAVCDRDSDRARVAAASVGVAKAYSTLEEVVQDKEIDLVVDLTNHSQHYAVVRALLLGGKHVYAEKPFANSYTEAMELTTMASERGLVLGCAPQVDLSDRNIAAKQLLDSGALGTISLVRASGSNLGPASRRDTNYDPEWFYQDGGSVTSLGIYTLAALHFFLGSPKSVMAYEGIVFRTRTVKYGPAKGRQITVTAPDNCAVAMEFEPSTYALFDGSYAVPTPPRHEFEIHGEFGSMLVGGFDGADSVQFYGLEQPVRNFGPVSVKPWNLSWGVERCVSHLRAGTVDPSAGFVTSVIRTIDAIRQSAATGRRIEL